MKSVVSLRSTDGAAFWLAAGSLLLKHPTGRDQQQRRTTKITCNITCDNSQTDRPNSEDSKNYQGSQLFSHQHHVLPTPRPSNSAPILRRPRTKQQSNQNHYRTSHKPTPHSSGSQKKPPSNRPSSTSNLNATSSHSKPNFPQALPYQPQPQTEKLSATTKF